MTCHDISYILLSCVITVDSGHSKPRLRRHIVRFRELCPQRKCKPGEVCVKMSRGRRGHVGEFSNPRGNGGTPGSRYSCWRRRLCGDTGKPSPRKLLDPHIPYPSLWSSPSPRTITDIPTVFLSAGTVSIWYLLSSNPSVHVSQLCLSIPHHCPRRKRLYRSPKTAISISIVAYFL